jgi:hypothetical protein
VIRQVFDNPPVAPSSCWAVEAIGKMVKSYAQLMQVWDAKEMKSYLAET